jgi:hypothetical protein
LSVAVLEEVKGDWQWEAARARGRRSGCEEEEAVGDVRKEKRA